MSVLLSLAQTTYDFTTSTSGSSSSNPVGSIIQLVLGLISIVGLWKVFIKAGQPGWAAIIPFYNIYVVHKVAKEAPWKMLLLLIPIINIIWAIILQIRVGRQFGKSGVWSFFLLAVFGFVGYLMLGFGQDPYLNLPGQDDKTTPVAPVAPAAPQAPVM
jgi:Family of unknown function (DUF5684)